MAGYISEFFGFDAHDNSQAALHSAQFSHVARYTPALSPKNLHKKSCEILYQLIFLRLLSDTVGLNWENVSKRIIPQIIYKRQVLQREALCRTGLFLVCPKPVYRRILDRLGGTDKLPKFPSQPASVNFIAYDAVADPIDGHITPLGIVEEHCTTVYKVQEAFSSLNLPDGNVYRDAISRALYPDRYKELGKDKIRD
ncbi:MAG: hypothetical protein NC342_01325 [Pseudoflavonifractor sp.]|nr:hypothetical protein [Alloprevotella sp.]MCM1116165.1 hypothetical protein [Pseudoflavonifractor sp.]